MRKTREEEPQGFADFWAVWLPISRHTDGRGLARTTYRSHILAGAMPQDIIDGAKWFIRNLKERDKEFVPLAATWINREAYSDFAALERRYQESLTAKRENVVPIRQAAPLPDNHFSVLYARRQQES